eukprot:scaffold2659_cov107-Cylindrotheca_fusiformis.AAC.3
MIQTTVSISQPIHTHNPLNGQPTVSSGQVKHHPSRKTAMHVSFAAEVLVMETMGLNNYTVEEISQTWYSYEEMEEIKEECYETMEKISEHRPLQDTARYCIRGLENNTQIGYTLKYMNRDESVQIVLEEQRRQLEKGEGVDENSISKAYRNATSSSHMWARVIGNRDRHWADLYLDGIDTAYIMCMEDYQISNGKQVRSVSGVAREEEIPKNAIMPRAA